MPLHPEDREAVLTALAPGADPMRRLQIRNALDLDVATGALTRDEANALVRDAERRRAAPAPDVARNAAAAAPHAEDAVAKGRARLQAMLKDPTYVAGRDTWPPEKKPKP